MVNFELSKETENDVWSQASDKEKNENILRPHEEHDAINIADWSLQYACYLSYVNLVMALLTIVSLWLSDRASEPGIQRSEPCFLTGTQIFFFGLCLWQDAKHLSLKYC